MTGIDYPGSGPDAHDRHQHGREVRRRSVYDPGSATALPRSPCM